MPEILRRLANIVRFGTITETKSADGKALARVKIGDRVSDFLPVVSFAGGFRRHWVPVRPGEQVLVFSPFGEADSGAVVRGLFHRTLKEPAGANDTTEIIEWEDGTRVEIDTAAKRVKLKTPGSLLVQAGSVTVEAPSTHISGDLVVGGTIMDARGDLTNFATTDGAARA